MKKKRNAPPKEVLEKGRIALEKYRKELAEAKNKGGTFFKEWQEIQRIKREQRRISPQQAIKNFCNDCVGGIRQDITNCTSFKCPLYIYRPYQKGEE
jgi:hypothetical protein